MRNRQIPIKYYRDHWAKIYEILSVKTGLSNIIRSWCASDYESCGLWVEPPSKTKPGEPGDPFFFFGGQWSVVGRFPKSCPLSFFHPQKIRIFEDIKLMSLHQNSMASPESATWFFPCRPRHSLCPRVSTSTLCTRLASTSWTTTLETQGIFLLERAMLPWLPWYFLPKWALSYYIQYIQFDNDEPNKNTHLFLTKSKTCFNTKLCCMRITLMLSCRCPPSPSTGPPNQLPHWPWKPIRLGEEKNRYPKWTRSLTAFGVYASDIIVLEISKHLQAYLNSLPYCSSERKTFLETPGTRAFQASAQHSSSCQTSLINTRELKEKHYDIDTVNCKRSMLWAAIPCVPSSVSLCLPSFPQVSRP